MDRARTGGSPKPHFDTAIIEDFANTYCVEAATTEAERRTAFRVRYQIYCLEHAFLDEARFADGRETDHLDDRAVHGLLRHRQSGIVCGTTRLILPAENETQAPIYFYEICESATVLPRSTTSEISRFATSKVLRQRCMHFPDSRALAGSGTLPSLMTISLMTFTVQQALRHGTTHLCAVMTPPLLRLLKRFSVHCHSLGGLVNYHGLRQPCYLSIDQLLADLEAEQPALWSMVTDNGRLEAPWQTRVA